MKWHGFDNQEEQLLNAIWKEVIEKRNNLAFPKTCPSCNSRRSLHFYIHLYNYTNRRGGAWFWCSKCNAFFHSSAIIPSWWINLSKVEFNSLTAVPDYLETLSKEIDAHWATFQQFSV